MTDIKISLMPNADLALEDLIPILDVSATDAALINKKTSVEDILALIPSTPPTPPSATQYLTQNTTWYVDTNGDDANDGLTLDTPFLTLGKASLEAAKYLNPNKYTRTIILQPGIHEGANLAGYHNFGIYDDKILIQGESCNTGDVTVLGITITSSSVYDLLALTLAPNPINGHCLVLNNARVTFEFLHFIDAPGYHIAAWNHSTVEIVGDYFIEGSATSHIYLDSFSFLDTSCVSLNRTILIDNNPSFDTFAHLRRNSYLSAESAYFFGGEAITGKRYTAADNSVIQTYQNQQDYLPGNVNGELLSGAKYYNSDSEPNPETPSNTCADSISGHIESPQNKTYTLDMDAYATYQVEGIMARASSGSCDIMLLRNGAPFDFMPIPLTVGSSYVELNRESTYNYVYLHNRLTLVLSNVQAAEDLTFSVKIQKDCQPISSPAA